MTTSGHRGNSHTDSDVEMDVRPPTTRSKTRAKSKGKARARIVSPPNVPESEDDLPVIIPLPTKRSSTVAAEVPVKRRRVDSIASDDSIQEIAALTKTVSRVGATKPEVLLPKRKKGVAVPAKAASGSGMVTLVLPPLNLTSHPERPKPKKVSLQDILARETPVQNTGGNSAGDAAEALGHGEALHRVNTETTEAQQHVAKTLFPPEEIRTALHRTSAAETTEAIPVPPALSPVLPPALPHVTSPPTLPAKLPQHPALSPVTPSPVLPATLPQHPASPYPPFPAPHAQHPGQAQLNLATPNAMGTGVAPGPPTIGFPGHYPTHPPMPPMQAHPPPTPQYPYYPTSPYGHPGYWPGGGYPYMMPPPAAYGMGGYPPPPTGMGQGGSEEAPSGAGS
jgi:hypothetical protein